MVEDGEEEEKSDEEDDAEVVAPPKKVNLSRHGDFYPAAMLFFLMYGPVAWQRLDKRKWWKKAA